ncbi:ankyrin repeat domain-containing protein [Antrihabitans stalactiti]|uniref:Ankyrin repeat domain-containing protein n=1 Tax=Antrihabitans stalactiti TaxID=2584121 RepID=A0A848KTK6_9NOCA|nr:ankyrin repeat domain-containing protein [Antrihabitans stalactiti]NMN98887.1 ankyrin repeat domain-containing protein [Antrihabitans stalactiti]
MAKQLLTLPKDFRERGEPYTLGELQEIFATRSVDARGGYSKEVALAMRTVRADGVRWLLDQGADIEAESNFGRTPLTSRISHKDVEVVRLLLERGADPVDSAHKDTPLGEAATTHQLEIVELLLAAGADVHATDTMGWTPLDLAVLRTDPHNGPNALPVIRLLASRHARLNDQVPPYLRRAMANLYRFEAAGNVTVDMREALNEVLAMFDVTPPARPRVLADGEPIVVSSTDWRKQFSELWGMLVPNGGAAASVQGEVVRIAGRIGHDYVDKSGRSSLGPLLVRIDQAAELAEVSGGCRGRYLHGRSAQA